MFCCKFFIEMFFSYILLRVEFQSRFKKHSIFPANPLWYTHLEGGNSMSNIIGKNIHVLRKKQGLTQEDLAGLVNVCGRNIKHLKLSVVRKWRVNTN